MGTCRLCNDSGEDAICHECLGEWWEKCSATKDLRAKVERLRGIIDSVWKTVNDAPELVDPPYDEGEARRLNEAMLQAWYTLGEYKQRCESEAAVAAKGENDAS